MFKIEDIKVINVDSQAFQVDSLPENIQNLIEFYNEWRRDEMNAKSELIKVQSAMRDISREIINNIKAEQENVENASNEEPVVEDDEPQTDTDGAGDK